MRRTIYAVAFLCFAVSAAFSQNTTTLSAHLADLGGSNVTSKTYLKIELRSDGGNQCRVAGVGVITPYVKTVKPDSSGNISQTLYKTSSITCGSSTGNSKYLVTVFQNGIAQPGCYLQISSATTLESASCLNNTSTPVTSSPTDSVYARIDASNVGWTGDMTFNSHNTTGIGNIGAATESLSGQLTSTLATGTAPFSIASTTVVPNLNVSQLLGSTWASPAAIGTGTPAAGTFTTATATTAFVAPGTSAATGVFRVPNNTAAITARNSANNGDFSIIKLGTDNLTHLIGGGADMSAPVATDTIVGRATTDTLTNKTLTGATTGNNVSVVNIQGAVGPLTGNSSDQVIYTYSLPANTVDSTSKGIRITVSAVHASGTANTTLSINLNGQNVINGSSGTAASQSVTFQATIIRTASTTGGSMGINTSGNALLPFSKSLSSLAWTSSQTITFTFNVANTDTWTGIMFMVEQIQ